MGGPRGHGRIGDANDVGAVGVADAAAALVVAEDAQATADAALALADPLTSPSVGAMLIGLPTGYAPATTAFGQQVIGAPGDVWTVTTIANPIPGGPATIDVGQWVTPPPPSNAGTLPFSSSAVNGGTVVIDVPDVAVGETLTMRATILVEYGIGVGNTTGGIYLGTTGTTGDTPIAGFNIDTSGAFATQQTVDLILSIRNTGLAKTARVAILSTSTAASGEGASVAAQPSFAVGAVLMLTVENQWSSAAAGSAYVTGLWVRADPTP